MARYLKRKFVVRKRMARVRRLGYRRTVKRASMFRRKHVAFKGRRFSRFSGGRKWMATRRNGRGAGSAPNGKIIKFRFLENVDYDHTFNNTNRSWDVREIDINGGHFLPPLSSAVEEVGEFLGYETRKLIGLRWRFKDLHRFVNLRVENEAAGMIPGSLSSTTTRIPKWRMYHYNKTYAWGSHPGAPFQQSFKTSTIKDGGSGPWCALPHMKLVNTANAWPSSLGDTWAALQVTNLQDYLLDHNYSHSHDGVPSVNSLYSANMYTLFDEVYPGSFWATGALTTYTGYDTVSGVIELETTWACQKKVALAT
jgi:hypothetical protein